MTNVLAPFQVCEPASSTALEIIDGVDPSESSLAAGNVRVARSGVGGDGHLFDYQYGIDQPRATFACRLRPDFHGKLRRQWRDAADLATSYHGLWAFLHLALLRHGCGFVHGGCVVERDGSSLLIAGAGGSGKTSTTLALLGGGRWRYQAEDLALVDENGMTHLSPRPLTIYHSDIRWGNRLLTGYEARLPALKRLFWHAAAMLGRNPRARVRYDHLLDSTDVEPGSAALSSVFLIRRTTTQGVLDTEDLGPQAMSEHLLGVSMRELFALYEPLLQTQGALGPDTPRELALESVFSSTRSLYRSALEGSRCVRITASQDVPPGRIAETIDTGV